MSYPHDGNGTIVKRTNADGSWTVYIAGIFEMNLTTGAVTKYYSAGGRPIAMRKGGTLSYLLADHLGGTTTVLDAAGNLAASRKYWPYGAEREVSGDQRATDRWYTGQRDEDFDGLGLYNYKARFYSTTLGRFASVDPVVGSADDPQSWNGYAYVRNNPLRYTDPTGMCTAGELVIILDMCGMRPAGYSPSTPAPQPLGVYCELCEALRAIAFYEDLRGVLLYCATGACATPPVPPVPPLPF